MSEKQTTRLLDKPLPVTPSIAAANSRSKQKSTQSTSISTFTKTMVLLSAGLLSTLIAYFSLGPSSVVGQDASSSDIMMDDRGCPIYTDYSMEPHGDKSSGPLGLPYMRPEERCRTFNSSAVEVSPLDYFL